MRDDDDGGCMGPLMEILLIVVAVFIVMVDGSDLNSCSRRDRLHQCQQCHRYTEQTTCPYCPIKVVD
ncbi:MAG: RNA-protein complex protein Nop10 [Bacteroidales bacterium]|nr:RNA-protein complex protein Nop10 [Bacteroidales bacterium]